VTPPRRHSGECTAENVPGDFVPAVVRYRGERVAEVWHENGAGAENLRLCATRLQRRGIKVFIIRPPQTRKEIKP